MPSAGLTKDLMEIISYVKSYLYYQEFLGIKGSAEVGKQVSLEDIKKEIVHCQKCSLSTTRTQVVFGTGKEDAGLMLIGEAPGEEEDIKGEPFVGMAGQLLTRILNAIGLDRKDVYITNIVKCRPPHNRNPKAGEIKACKPYLLKQISVIRPKIICTLGTFAAQTLLETGEKISQLRGRFYDYQGIKLIPTYHPAFILRYPQMKKPLWDDMQLIKRKMEGHDENPSID